MIDRIQLENFKCFSNMSMELGSLNVFSGINGMGKSTTIQAILLLLQSHQQGYLPSYIALNGEYTSLGTGKDVLFEEAESERIGITISEAENSYSTQIEYDANLDVLKTLKYDRGLETLLNVPFEYLNAERSAPQVIYPKSSYYIEAKGQLGTKGEYTAHYLAKYQDKKIFTTINNEPGELLLKEAVQSWLNEISPNVKLEANSIDNTDLARLGFYYTDNGKSNIFRPTNVGFGISYILPVIVALLKATPGSLVIVENPEAHLHPHGQRKMGELIANCSARGVQILLETHSDHILNGIRIAVKKREIDYKTVKLFYFNKKNKQEHVVHTVETPKINENGKLDYWPDGFFDEWEKALDEII